MPDCIFCKIVNKQIPANIIYEDKNIIAFDDIHPKAPVHKLIIPKQHIETVNHIEAQHQELVGKLFTTVASLAKQMGIADEGYRLLMNCNKHGGQEVYHIHLHMIGGKQLSWTPGA